MTTQVSSGRTWADVACPWVKHRSAESWGCYRTEHGSHVWLYLGLSSRCFMETLMLGSEETWLLTLDESEDHSPFLWLWSALGHFLTCCLCLTVSFADFSKLPLHLLVSSFWWKTSKYGAQILAPSSTLTPWRTIFSLEVSICSLVLFEFLSVSLGFLWKLMMHYWLSLWQTCHGKWKLRIQKMWEMYYVTLE